MAWVLPLSPASAVTITCTPVCLRRVGRGRDTSRAATAVRDHALVRGAGGAVQVVAGFGGGAGDALSRLLVSALCVCARDRTHGGGCSGFDPGVFRTTARARLAPGRPAGERAVPDIPARCDEAIPDQRVASRYAAETWRGSA